MYDPRTVKTETLWQDYYHYSAILSLYKDENNIMKQEVLTQRNIVAELVRRGEIETT